MKFHQSQTQVLSPRFLCACGRQDNACRNMAPPGITPETRCVFRTSETCLRTAGSRKQMPERTCACSGTADATSWSAYEEPRPCRWRPYGRNAERLMRPLPQKKIVPPMSGTPLSFLFPGRCRSGTEQRAAVCTVPPSFPARRSGILLIRQGSVRLCKIMPLPSRFRDVLQRGIPPGAF